MFWIRMIHTRPFYGLFWFRAVTIAILLCGASLALEVSTTPKVSAPVGGTVELPCQTSLADALVYWYYGNTVENATTLVVNVFRGEVIPRRDNVDMTSDFTLVIAHVGVADSGVYVCKVVPSPFEGSPKSSATVLDVTADSSDTSTATNLASSTSSSAIATTPNTILPQQETTFSTALTTPNSTTSARQEIQKTTLVSRGKNNGTSSNHVKVNFMANQQVFTEGSNDVASTMSTFAPTTTMTTKERSNVKGDSDKIQVDSENGNTIIVAVSVVVFLVVIALIFLIICYIKRSKQNVQNRGPTDVSYTGVSQGQTDTNV